MIANHGCCVGVPTRKDRQPPTLFIHRYQRLHHISRLLRSDDVIEWMNSAIGVPHGVVAIILPFSHGKLTIGKRRISSIHVTHLVRQEAAAIESTIELVHTSRIRILNVDGVQTIHPLLGQLLHHTVKVMPLSLKGKIVLCTSFRDKRGGCLQDYRLMSLTSERKPRTKAVAPRILDFIVSLEQIMTIETSMLTPALIDAMNRIIAIDRLILLVDLQVSLALIAVMVQDDVYWTVLLWGDTENGRMTAASHLHLQMLLRQTDSIVMRMRDLFCMREWRSPFCWSQTQLATKCSEGKRAIVLRTTTHNPMTVAETL